jgi:hypothetical protein
MAQWKSLTLDRFEGNRYDDNAKHLALRVYERCREESAEGRITSTINPRKRASSYLGIGDGTLKRWKEAADGRAEEKSAVGGDRRSGGELDRFVIKLVNITINQLLDRAHATGTAISISKMYAALKGDVTTANWFASKSSFWLHLSNNGYVWKKSNKYKLAKMRPAIVNRRLAYIARLQQNK